jgi:hypothetical protein
MNLPICQERNAYPNPLFQEADGAKNLLQQAFPGSGVNYSEEKIERNKQKKFSKVF